MKANASMWQLKSLDVLNPSGLVVRDEIEWKNGVHFYGPHRESLFLGVCRKTLNPELHIEFNFNPRAQLFCGIGNIFRMTEKLLELSASEPDDAKIGSWLGGGHNSMGGNIHADNLLIILRAEVLYLFGTICALSSEVTANKLRLFCDHLAAANAQSDELIPLLVEHVLGRELRTIFENLCGQYYFQSSQRQAQRRESLFNAERVLSDLCSQPLKVTWNSQQKASMCARGVEGNGIDSDACAVFLPFVSSNSDSEVQQPPSETCAQLLQAGVQKFFYVDSFVEQLRWVERLSIARQVVRMNAVREDPLRSQSFFDARSGRSRILVLSDESLLRLEKFLKNNKIADFSLSIQEKIETAFELRDIRSASNLKLSPQFDLILLAHELSKASHPHTAEAFFSKISGYERLLENNQFSSDLLDQNA